MTVNTDPKTILETGGMLLCLAFMMLFLGAGLVTFNNTLLLLAGICFIGVVVFSLSGKPLVQPDA